MARVPQITRRNNISQVAASGPKQVGLGWAAIADMAKLGENIVRPHAIKEAKAKGAQAVYRDADGRFKVDEIGLLGGELAEAYNSAAYASFMANRTIDMSETFTELSVKHEFDPEGFRLASEAYVKSLSSEQGIPDLLKEEIVLQAKQEASRRFNGIFRSNAKRRYAESNRKTSKVRDILADDYVNLMTEGQVEDAQGVYANLEEVTEFRKNAPYIEETQAAGDAYLRGIRGAAKAAQLTRQLEKLEGADALDPAVRERIQGLINDPEIDPAARASLYRATKGKLKGIDGRLIGNAVTGESPAAAAQRYKGEAEADLVPVADAEDVKEPLKEAGVQPSNGSEFLAHIIGIEGAASVFGADVAQDVSDVLPEAVLKQVPEIMGMTVSEAINWAERKGTTKSSDIAAQAPRLGQIEDDDVRQAAEAELSEKLRARRAIEEEAAAGYVDQLKKGDASLTEEEVLSDHSLSDIDQSEIVKDIRKQKEFTAKVQATVTALADPQVFFDTYQSSVRTDLDKAFNALRGNAHPFSLEGQKIAAQMAVRTGSLPRTSFNAARAAIHSNDPQEVAQAVEFVAQVLDQIPGAIEAHGGKTEVLDAVADYRFLAGFMPGEEASARMIENRQKPVAPGVEKLAKSVAKEVTSADLAKQYDALDLDVEFGNSVQEASIMADYRRLYKDAYERTGDADLAGARAFEVFKRRYGPNIVSGHSRLMAHPPQGAYPPVDGSYQWMTDQLVSAVSEFDRPAQPDDGRRSQFEMLFNDGEPLQSGPHIKAKNIFLISDATTSRLVSSGKPPTYQVQYLDQDGIMQTVAKRFQFEHGAAQDAATTRAEEAFNAETINREQLDVIVEEMTQEMAQNPDAFTEDTDILSALTKRLLDLVSKPKEQ